jgi:hypothetical protein
VLQYSQKAKKGKEGVMPSIFKALASIVAWVLFILGLVGVVGGLLIPTLSGQLFVVGINPPLQVFIGLGLSVGTLILSVCVMKLRHLLE